MNKFWIIAKYNLRFLFSNWISKIFIILITGLILFASFTAKTGSVQGERAEPIKITVNHPQIQLIFEQTQNQFMLVSKDADYEINKTSNDTFELVIKKPNLNDTTTNLVYGLLDATLNPKAYQIEVTQGYESNNSILGIVTSLVLYISMIFIGNMVITAVSLEKTSKMLDLISYKTSSLSIIYGKCAAVLIYIFLLCLLCGGEILILNYFNLIELNTINELFSLSQLGLAQWGYLLLSFLAAVVVFMQLYVITGLFIVDASQLQLSQLPMTLLTFACYSLNLIALMDNQYRFLVDLTQYIPFSFPFGILLKLFVFNDLTPVFLLTGLAISILFIGITYWLIKNYLLPKKMV